jgi:hypothetical protein
MHVICSNSIDHNIFNLMLFLPFSSYIDCIALYTISILITPIMNTKYATKIFIRLVYKLLLCFLKVDFAFLYLKDVKIYHDLTNYGNRYDTSMAIQTSIA